jgi:hypothetical protein
MLGQNQGSSWVSSADQDVPQVMPFEVSREGIDSVPNTFQMGDDLMGLFDAFGQTDAEAMAIFEDPLLGLDPNYMSMTFPMEISRRFQNLI